MKEISLFFMCVLFAFVSHAAMYVCYGNENNCFGSNANCSDLPNPCSTEPGDFTTNGCNCTQINWTVVTVNDENGNPRLFKIDNSGLHIQNAEATAWVTIYDITAIDEEMSYQFRYVSALNRVVIDVYRTIELEYEFEQTTPNILNAWEETINVSYAD